MSVSSCVRRDGSPEVETTRPQEMFDLALLHTTLHQLSSDPHWALIFDTSWEETFQKNIHSWSGRSPFLRQVTKRDIFKCRRTCRIHSNEQPL